MCWPSLFSGLHNKGNESGSDHFIAISTNLSNKSDEAPVAEAFKTHQHRP
jgi:hypothetical protein